MAEALALQFPRGDLSARKDIKQKEVTPMTTKSRNEKNGKPKGGKAAEKEKKEKKK